VAPIVSTPLRVQHLGNDGITLLGSATTILDNEGASDDGIVEAPSLLHRQGTWYLFFSANCYTTDRYNVRYATATSVTGPYTRASKPLFATGNGNGLVAPGGADVDHDGRHMLFHAQSGDGRAMYTALLNFDGTTVSA
jgi:beta-xylosidase